MSCGPRLIKNGLFQSGKVFYGQTSPNLTFLLEITDAVPSGPKRRKTFQRVIRISFIARYLYTYEEFVFMTEATAVQHNDSDRT